MNATGILYHWLITVQWPIGPDGMPARHGQSVGWGTRTTSGTVPVSPGTRRGAVIADILAYVRRQDPSYPLPEPLGLTVLCLSLGPDELLAVPVLEVAATGTEQPS